MISTFSDRMRNGKREMEGSGVKRGGIKKTAVYRKLHHCVSLDLDCLLNHTATTQRFCLFWVCALLLFLAFLFSETGFLLWLSCHSLHRPSCPWSQRSYLYLLRSAGTEGVHHTPGFSPILSLQTQFITFFSFLFQRMFGSDHVFFFFFTRERLFLWLKDETHWQVF